MKLVIVIQYLAGRVARLWAPPKLTAHAMYLRPLKKLSTSPSILKLSIPKNKRNYVNHYEYYSAVNPYLSAFRRAVSWWFHSSGSIWAKGEKSPLLWDGRPRIPRPTSSCRNGASYGSREEKERVPSGVDLTPHMIYCLPLRYRGIS